MRQWKNKWKLEKINCSDKAKRLIEKLKLKLITLYYTFTTFMTSIIIISKDICTSFSNKIILFWFIKKFLKKSKSF